MNLEQYRCIEISMSTDARMLRDRTFKYIPYVRQQQT